MTLSSTEHLSALTSRLLEPADLVTLSDLTRRWFHQTIVVTCDGYGDLTDKPELSGRIRGAWGHELMRSASASALSGNPCNWTPPCAYDVLFREQGKITPGLSLPRPVVVSTKQDGPNLVVRMTVFGFACDWIEAASTCLIASLRTRDPLRDSKSASDKEAHILSRKLLSFDGLVPPEKVSTAELHFFTPVALRGKGDIRESFGALIASLGNRISALARWQDSEVDADWRMLVDLAEGCSLDASDLREVKWRRGSNRQGGRVIPMRGYAGNLVVTGNLSELAGLLMMGATCHAGSHSALGLGAYELTLF